MAVEFVIGATSPNLFPSDGLPEIAFVGRSNVGKSSLLNTLLLRGRKKGGPIVKKDLARTSATPGRTQTINFFRVDEKMYFVDLPGYGYAKVSASAVEKWTRLTRDYLRGRTSLKRVLLLIDSRHGLKPTDLEIMDVLDQSAVVYMIVLTKTDKLKAAEIKAVQEATAKAISRRPGAFPRLCAVSSKSGAGLEELRAEIAALAG